MRKIGTIYALAAIAVAGKHFEPGDKVVGAEEDEKLKLVTSGRASEEKPEELLAARKASDRAAARLDAEQEDARQAEIEETIRAAVEKIVGAMLDKRLKPAKAEPAPPAEKKD